MKHLKKYNEGFVPRRPPKFNTPDVESPKKKQELLDMPSPQDVAHYEIVIKDGIAYMKISTDYGVFYSKLLSEKDFNDIL